MPDFTDMVAKAVSPTMSREEREAVYRIVREAVLRLGAAEGTSGGAGEDPDDVRLVFQQHLAEDTIRDVETEITRYLALRRLEGGEGTSSPDGTPG